MTKAAVAALCVVTLALSVGRPAGSGVEVNPSTFKLLNGQHVSEDPITELSGSDDDYLFIDGTERKAASYQVTFVDIPDLEGTTQLRIQLLAKGTPQCVLRTWHWRKDRFVTVGDPINVTGSESETFITLDNPGRFVRKDKARTRLACTNNSPFILATDLLRFVP